LRRSHILEVTLNGEAGKPSLAASFIRALNDAALITEKGGFIFKALIDSRRLVLGVTPCFIDGRRTYHFDTKLPGEDEFTLIGSVTPGGVFEILFKPASLEISTDSARKYADSYIMLARFLLENGYSGMGKLDQVTVGMLHEAGLFCPAPESLFELASETCSLDMDN
jgi:hypothetical protein